MACGRRPPVDITCAYLFEFSRDIFQWISDNAAGHSIAQWVDIEKAVDHARSLTLETRPALALGGDASKCMAAYLEAKRTRTLGQWFASIDPSWEPPSPKGTPTQPISNQQFFVADTMHTKESWMYVGWVSNDPHNPVAALPRAKVFYEEDLQEISQQPHLVAIPVAKALRWGVRPFPSRIHRDVGPAIPNTREVWLAMTGDASSTRPKFHQGCTRTWSKDWM